MKIFKKLLNTLPLLLLLLTISLLLPTKSEAAQFNFKPYSLSQEETVNEDLYIVADEIVIDGVVDGDVIAIGDSIQINGTITGDTHFIARMVNINANIYGNTFVIANNTNIQGVITENTSVISTYLNYDADTQGNVLGIFAEGTLKGSVGKNLRAIAMTSSIDSVVRGDLLLLTDQNNIRKENITGEIYDVARLKEIAKAQGVDLDRESKPERTSLTIFTTKPTWQYKSSMMITNLFAMLLVGFIIIMLSPVKTYQIQEKITGSTNEFVKSLVTGFIISLLIPLPLFILYISIIGTPAAILITGLLIFVTIFGRIWVETAFGREILAMFNVKEYRPFKSFLIGRVLTVLISIIPIVRGFYNIILGFVALGAVVRMKREYYQIANKQAKEYNKLKTDKKKIIKKSTKKTEKKK